MKVNELREIVKKYNESEKEILVFSAYLPFLGACRNLGQSRKVTALITDIPEYYDMHQVSKLRELVRKLYNKLVYHYMKYVDRFVLLTEQMRVPLHGEKRPYIVMEGICDTRILPVRQEENMIFSLLYSGRLNKRYGLGMLLDAMKKIDDPNIQLWICGSGEMEVEIQEQAQIDSRIKFFGFLSHTDVLTLQQRASALINPRTNKGEYTKYSFPSKTMEYMASGRPVVMYHLDGIPTEYDPYLFYIPEETPDSICQTILKLREMEPKARAHVAKQAREFVINQKNESVQMKRVLDFIKLSE